MELKKTEVDGIKFNTNTLQRIFGFLGSSFGRAFLGERGKEGSHIIISFTSTLIIFCYLWETSLGIHDMIVSDK